MIIEFANEIMNYILDLIKLWKDVSSNWIAFMISSIWGTFPVCSSIGELGQNILANIRKAGDAHQRLADLASISGTKHKSL